MDTWFGVYCGRSSVNLVLEKMGIVDWAIDRDEWSLQSNYTPLSVVRGQLAESYDISPDGLTYTSHIRPGVHWQDKAPMNGRELVAEDIVFNFHRITGLGSGFTEKSEYTPNVALLPIESIEATDKYTVLGLRREVPREPLALPGRGQVFVNTRRLHEVVGVPHGQDRSADRRYLRRGDGHREDQPRTLVEYRPSGAVLLLHGCAQTAL